MPARYEGKFSAIVEEVHAYLDANKATFGFKRVTLGGFPDGLMMPEALVTHPADDGFAAGDRGDAATKAPKVWRVPVVVIFRKEYAKVKPTAGDWPLTDAVLLGEKVADLLVAQHPPPGGARSCQLTNLVPAEDFSEEPFIMAVALRFLYEVVVQ